MLLAGMGFSSIALSGLSLGRAQDELRVESAAATVTQLDVECSFDRGVLFDEIVETVHKNHYRADDAQRLADDAGRWRERAVVATGHSHFASIINEMLATLGSSHTKYYSRLDPLHYQLLSIFEHLHEDADPSWFQYEGIGIETKQVEGRELVSAVYDGSTAAKAGVRFGDQIVAVDDKPYHPILSFRGKVDQAVVVAIFRNQRPLRLTIQVELLDDGLLERAVEASCRVIERDGQEIGYIHMWSYGGDRYRSLLELELTSLKLANCDSLILDLRDGWGGASLSDLDFFRPSIAKFEVQSRGQSEPQLVRQNWDRPVVLLVNADSRSGKEMFTYGFQKLGLGKVIGEKTAGAVLAGRPYTLTNGDLLYLAVQDVLLDGKRLEGVGVEPDIAVRRELTALTERDEQLEAAIDHLSKHEIKSHQ